jgi:hypothetical protein
MNYPDALTINVTTEHIADGVCQSDDNCPIALATIEAISALPDDFDKPVTVSVATYGLYIDAKNDAEGVDYSLPTEARQFITAFDAKLPVAPFSFIARFNQAWTQASITADIELLERPL